MQKVHKVADMIVNNDNIKLPDYEMPQMSKPVQEDHLLGEKCQS